MYSNNAYNCCFTEHSKVTAHKQTDQLHQGDSGGLQEGPARIRTGRRQSTWLGSQHSQSLKASPLQKTYWYIYIHTHCSVLSGPHLESMTRSPLIGLNKVSTQLSSMGVRRQLSSVGSVSANCNMWRVNIAFYIRWNMDNKCRIETLYLLTFKKDYVILKD